MNYGARECAMYFNAKDIYLQDLNFVESIERRCEDELQWLRQERHQIDIGWKENLSIFEYWCVFCLY